VKPEVGVYVISDGDTNKSFGVLKNAVVVPVMEKLVEPVIVNVQDKRSDEFRLQESQFVSMVPVTDVDAPMLYSTA